MASAEIQKVKDWILYALLTALIGSFLNLTRVVSGLEASLAEVRTDIRWIKSTTQNRTASNTY